MEQNQPVIIIKKKKHVHGGHHGGSWKVAYADFVTAMMAFFLVMWIISMDQPTRLQIQNYFNDPSSASNSRAGISKLAAGGLNPLASGFAGAMDTNTWIQKSRDAQRDRFERVERNLEKKIASRPDLSRLKGSTEIRVTDQALSIELIEKSDSTFFESGSARVPSDTSELLGLIARELGTLANSVVIEGHTDTVPYRGQDGYSNWELSTDRANAARRAMVARGLRPDQVVGVRGYADSRLRDPEHPTDRSNRRVSILVAYGTDAAEQKPAPEPEKPFEVEVKPGADTEPHH